MELIIKETEYVKKEVQLMCLFLCLKEYDKATPKIQTFQYYKCIALQAEKCKNLIQKAINGHKIHHTYDSRHEKMIWYHR